MFILHLLPDSFLAFIVNAILLLGTVATVLSFTVLDKILQFIPGVGNYRTVIKIASVAVLLVGVYFKGGYSTEMIWRERVREVEAKLAEAEQQSQQANQALATKLADAKKTYQSREIELLKNAQQIAKYDAECRIPPAFIELHNQAAGAIK